MAICKNCGDPVTGDVQICKACGAVQTYYQPVNTIGLGREEWNTQIVGLLGHSGELSERVLPDMQRVFGISSERYEALKTLGMGAVGMVYLARDKVTEELVAIKVLRPKLRKNSEIIARFRSEIDIAHKLKHPNIARVHSFNESDSGMYIVMQYIEGMDLAEYQRSHILSFDQKLSIMKAVCSAVEEAHNAGIIHRDLKPGNIMIDKDGKPYVVDFGIATMEDQADFARLGTFVGTPLYMSPEQAQGKKLDHRSDIYALGALFYELTAGRPPFIGESPINIALKHIRETPFKPRSLNPSIPPVVERVILRCLEKDPKGRPQTAMEIIREIEEPIQKEIAQAVSAARSGAGKEAASGDLRDVSLFQYLRVLTPLKRTFILEIVNNEEFGRYHFKGAHLVHGEARNLADEEVAYNLFYWTRGTYRVIYDPEPPEQESVSIPWISFVELYFAKLKRALLGVHGVAQGPVVMDLLDQRNSSLYRYVSDAAFAEALGEKAAIATDKFRRARTHFRDKGLVRVTRVTDDASILFCFLTGLRHFFYTVAEPRNDMEQIYQWIREELEQEMIEALHDSLLEIDHRRLGRGRMRKVMVAESEDFLGNLIRIKLRAMGMEVYLVRDGSRAVEVATQFRPDLVILNINIPGVSGYDICRMLGTDPMLQHIPIVLLTPYERGEEPDPVGVVHVLAKPLVLNELTEVVSRYANLAAGGR